MKHQILSRLSMQPNPQRPAHLNNGVKTRTRIRPQGFIQRLSSQPRRLGYFGHAARAGNITQRSRQQRRVIVFQNSTQIGGNILFVAQVFGRVKVRQIGNFNLLGHGSILNSSGQCNGLGNIGGLAGFIATAQHHDQQPAASVIACSHIIKIDTTTPRRYAVTTAPHWAGGFDSSFEKGAEAMRRKVRGFFYAYRSMVGVLGGCKACRFLFPGLSTRYTRRPLFDSSARCLFIEKGDCHV